jgi:hypothetical protein
MFLPSHSTLERESKVDVGLTALLTMSIVLLSLSDMIPKTPMSTFPFLGENYIFGFFCISMQWLLQANGAPMR